MNNENEPTTQVYDSNGRPVPAPIVEYVILTQPWNASSTETSADNARKKMTDAVNARIVNGWEPQGGVCVERFDVAKGCLFQAMVRRAWTALSPLMVKRT